MRQPCRNNRFVREPSTGRREFCEQNRACRALSYFRIDDV